MQKIKAIEFSELSLDTLQATDGGRRKHHHRKHNKKRRDCCCCPCQPPDIGNGTPEPPNGFTSGFSRFDDIDFSASFSRFLALLRG